MGNVTDKLNYLNETKKEIKQALIDKGVTVSDTDTFRSYADKITNISSGNEGVLTQEEYDNCLMLAEEILSSRTLDYIQSTGTQYIDTGINPYGKKLKIVFKVSDITTIGERYNIAIFGGYTSQGLNVGTLYRAYNSTSWNLYGKATNPFASNIFNGNNINFIEGYLEINDTGYSYEFNDTYRKSGNVSGQFPQNITLMIFGQNENGQISSSSIAAMKLYYFKIYLDDELVIDLIPSLDRDNVICLYDRVSKEYFYNKGTGNFIGGDIQ